VQKKKAGFLDLRSFRHRSGERGREESWYVCRIRESLGRLEQPEGGWRLVPRSVGKEREAGDLGCVPSGKAHPRVEKKESREGAPEMRVLADILATGIMP